MLKEVVMILLALLYLIVISVKYWGKKYKCVGLSEKYYRRFINKTKTKEEKCRNIFENLFGLSFLRCRPDFLKNPKTNRNLELDGFNSSIPTPLGMGLAFEYNGSQHYYYNPKYHSTYEKFEEQLERDNFKQKQCAKNGVLLITIPYTVSDHELENYITKKVYEKELYHYVK